MTESEEASLEKIEKELEIIKAYLKVIAVETMEKVLERCASTPERQEMWRLADGRLSNDQIAQKTNVRLRSVQYFVRDAEASGLLIMLKRGYPKRVADIFPSKWKPFKPEEKTYVNRDDLMNE